MCEQMNAIWIVDVQWKFDGAVVIAVIARRASSVQTHHGRSDLVFSSPHSIVDRRVCVLGSTTSTASPFAVSADDARMIPTIVHSRVAHACKQFSTSVALVH